MKYLLITFILVLTNCGSMKHRKINREFLPYYFQFEEIYGIPAVSSIDFLPDSSFKGKMVAFCRYEDKFIAVKPSSWEKYSEEHRKVLVFHELGHCMLNRDHRNDKLKDNCPTSIMNRKLLTLKCFLKHEQHYYEELL